MKLKELVSKMENVGYVLKEENGNEIEFDKLSMAEESKLMEQNVISFDVVEKDLEITIEMPKPKVKQTFTPKFNLGQKVYFCSNFISGKGKYRVNFQNDSFMATTKINGIKFSENGTRYDVDCKSTRLVCECELFETKEELIEYINNTINQAVDQLEEIE